MLAALVKGGGGNASPLSSASAGMSKTEVLWSPSWMFFLFLKNYPLHLVEVGRGKIDLE